MKHYAMIFRSTRTLTADELQRRAIEIQDWVKQVRNEGITLDPRIFGETVSCLFIDNGNITERSAPEDPALLTVVYFDAQSHEQALSVARIHPGLRYGAAIEVREWTAPQPTVR